MPAAKDILGHILVVDDDPRIRQMLGRYFEQEGYKVSQAGDGAAMRATLAGNSIDVVLLDVVLPGEDGFTLAREIRASSDVGILMLTGRGEVVDRIVGLEIGADDYIAKPFNLREVQARVRSVMRRRPGSAEAAKSGAVSTSSRGEDATDREIIRFDGWQLDFARRGLTAPDGRDVALTTGEFSLLEALARHPGRVFGRDTLMDLTRGRSREAFDRTIDAQIVRLRRKIEADPKNPALIKSVRGIGYVFTGKVEK